MVTKKGRKSKQYGVYDHTNHELCLGFYSTKDIAKMTNRSDAYIKLAIVKARKTNFDGSILIGGKYEIADVDTEEIVYD